MKLPVSQSLTSPIQPFTNKFLNPMLASDTYKKWRAGGNINQAQRWEAFAQAISQGQRPAPPTMVGFFGNALVGACLPYLNPKPAPAWSGLVAFTAQEPRLLIEWGLVSKFNLILLKADGTDNATSTDIAAMKLAGAKLGQWWSWNDPFTGLNLDGPLVYQVETPAEEARTMSVAEPWSVNEAIVWNMSDATLAPLRPAWIFAESNWRADPNNDPGNAVSAVVNRVPDDQRDWALTHTSPVFYLAGDKSFQQYEQAWGPANRALFLGEGMTKPDRAYCRTLPDAI